MARDTPAAKPRLGVAGDMLRRGSMPRVRPDACACRADEAQRRSTDAHTIRCTYGSAVLCAAAERGVRSEGQGVTTDDARISRAMPLGCGDSATQKTVARLSDCGCIIAAPSRLRARRGAKPRERVARSLKLQEAQE